MAKSSIHFRAALATSEAHNLRQVDLDYVVKDRANENNSFITETIADRSKTIARLCKEKSGRKLQKNAEPIREAVVNLNPSTTMEDLKHLAAALESEFKIKCFQIHIHRDEGHSDALTGEFKTNHHAHMLFDWQDKEKGTMLKLNRVQLSQIQTLVATTLDMERGELRVNTNRERLEPIEFKKQKALEDIKLLQEQTSFLEQKKNEAIERNKRLRERISSIESNPTEKDSKSLSKLLNDFSRQITLEDLEPYSEEDIRAAIDKVSRITDSEIEQNIREGKVRDPKA